MATGPLNFTPFNAAALVFRFLSSLEFVTFLLWMSRERDTLSGRSRQVGPFAALPWAGSALVASSPPTVTTGRFHGTQHAPCANRSEETIPPNLALAMNVNAEATQKLGRRAPPHCL